ncbi:MAG TPA: CBS domain-containing protein [Nitrososphaera sp.]
MTTDGYYDQYKDKSIMTQETIATGLFKRVGDVAEPDLIALPETMLLGEAVKIIRDKDVSSILVLEHISAVKARAITTTGDLNQLSHRSIYLQRSTDWYFNRKGYTLSCDGGK